MQSCQRNAAETANVKADEDIIIETLMPLMQKLLRSFDPATVDAAKGNNALHEMCILFPLDDVECWDCELVTLLIARGVSVHTGNKDGRTPLLLYAASFGTHISTAIAMRLLLAHGSDLNAQDSNGNGLLHHLVKRKAAAVLELLMCCDEVGHLDCHLVNSAGQTAADLAAVQLAQQADSNANSPQKRIHRLMMAQTALWTKRVQPLLRNDLSIVLPVTDVAKLALGYVDVSGLPFTAVAEAECDGEAESTAVVAVAAQS